jgi:hypothetical protein
MRGERDDPKQLSFRIPSARYMSSIELELILELLVELRETTLHRTSYEAATRLIVKLGCEDRLKSYDPTMSGD